MEPYTTYNAAERAVRRIRYCNSSSGRGATSKPGPCTPEGANHEAQQQAQPTAATTGHRAGTWQSASHAQRRVRASRPGHGPARDDDVPRTPMHTDPARCSATRFAGVNEGIAAAGHSPKHRHKNLMYN